MCDQLCTCGLALSFNIPPLWLSSVFVGYEGGATGFFPVLELSHLPHLAGCNRMDGPGGGRNFDLKGAIICFLDRKDTFVKLLLSEVLRHSAERADIGWQLDGYSDFMNH